MVGNELVSLSRRRALTAIGSTVGGVALTARIGSAADQHHIAIERNRGEVTYEFTVSGTLERGDELEGHDSIDGSTARGKVVGRWPDDFYYTGEITAFTMSGDGTVTIDGQRVDPAQLGSDDSTDGGDDGGGSEFVTTDGSRLVLDGARFAARGGNSFWLSYQYWDRAVIDELLSEYAKMGQNTVRLWGFGSGEPSLFQPEPRVYNESAFERLDYVVQQASEYGIRLNIALGNFWSDFGGIPQYVEWSDTADARDDFYTDDYCRQLYKDYVEHVLTRTNSLTGIEYRNDPTIMMWELLNEMRNPSAPDGDGTVLHNWTDEMAGYVKSLDSNHLVSTGCEGFVHGAGSKYDDVGYWMNTQGYDFVGIHRSEHIDIASIHLYPDHWNISDESAVQFIRDRGQEAREELNKPVYNGEFGKMDTPASTYQTWYDTMAAEEYDGAMFWQLVPNELESAGDDFTLLYPDHEATIDAIETGSGQL